MEIKRLNRFPLPIWTAPERSGDGALASSSLNLVRVTDSPAPKNAHGGGWDRIMTDANATMPTRQSSTATLKVGDHPGNP